jgi:hypothetical protein
VRGEVAEGGDLHVHPVRRHRGGRKQHDQCRPLLQLRLDLLAEPLPALDVVPVVPDINATCAEGGGVAVTEGVIGVGVADEGGTIGGVA